VLAAGGAADAVAGTAANNAAPTTTLTALLTNALLGSEEAAMDAGAGFIGEHTEAASGDRK
jgi:hypothetical protein